MDEYKLSELNEINNKIHSLKKEIKFLEEYGNTYCYDIHIDILVISSSCREVKDSFKRFNIEDITDFISDQINKKEKILIDLKDKFKKL